jgi:prepilin-type N-terminal cleavage/methylation domain-containing protein
MVANRTDSGFTIVELIIALVILSLFMALFFQLFMSSESQRVAVTRRAEANDIAETNMRKFQTQASLPSSITCDTTAGSTNTNNLINNSNATGSEITTSNDPSYSPETVKAPLNPSSSSTQQHVYELWPFGCGSVTPVEIKSVVIFNGANGAETITRATYIN